MTVELTLPRMRDATRELAAREPIFAGVLERYGMPPMWDRPAGFGTLLHIMLEQQVSLASARAAYDRLRALIGEPAPATLLALTDAQLREAGFSRQKARYARALATAIGTGLLDLDGLGALGDDEADAALRVVPGIGAWTAAIYRLSALGRPDAWPASDLAVLIAVERLWHLPARPAPEEATALAEAWRPWRSVAARLLWHEYLSAPRRRPGRSVAG
jgi:DNA-3-methyladenine glycosylase II